MSRIKCLLHIIVLMCLALSACENVSPSNSVPPSASSPPISKQSPEQPSINPTFKPGQSITPSTKPSQPPVPSPAVSMSPKAQPAELPKYLYYNRRKIAAEPIETDILQSRFDGSDQKVLFTIADNNCDFIALSPKRDFLVESCSKTSLYIYDLVNQKMVYTTHPLPSPTPEAVPTPGTNASVSPSFEPVPKVTPTPKISYPVPAKTPEPLEKESFLGFLPGTSETTGVLIKDRQARIINFTNFKASRALEPKLYSIGSIVWSPDKKYGLLRTYNGSEAKLYIFDEQGQELKTIFEGSWAWKPQWTHNNKIVFHTRKENTYDNKLAIINSDGSGYKKLTQENYVFRKMSPDGKSILVIKESGDGIDSAKNHDLYTLNLETLEIRLLQDYRASTSNYWEYYLPDGRVMFSTAKYGFDFPVRRDLSDYIHNREPSVISERVHQIFITDSNQENPQLLYEMDYPTILLENSPYSNKLILGNADALFEISVPELKITKFLNKSYEGAVVWTFDGEYMIFPRQLESFNLKTRRFHSFPKPDRPSSYFFNLAIPHL